jgi:hypothetical protein
MGWMSCRYSTNTVTSRAEALLPAWLVALLDHHVAHLAEHPRYQRIWWSARNGTSGIFVTLRIVAPPETLTAEDERAIGRLHLDGAARHPELICKGRAWCTDGSDMAVTWQYCPTVATALGQP